METPKMIFIFQETELCNNWGSNFLSSKNKKKTLLKSCLYFGYYRLAMPENH